MTNSTQLLLIRHGTTDANVCVPYILQGKGIDLPLNENGRWQAERVGKFLASFPIRQVFASPLKRAVETAEFIARHHALDVRHIAEISECDVGVWEGQDWDTIARTHPDAYRRFHDDPAANPYLGGESYADVLRRALPVFEKLLADHGGETIAVVAHNIVNRTYVAHLMGMELRIAKTLAQDNCCVNIIEHRDGHTTLVSLNEVTHLQDIV